MKEYTIGLIIFVVLFLTINFIYQKIKNKKPVITSGSRLVKKTGS